MVTLVSLPAFLPFRHLPTPSSSLFPPEFTFFLPSSQSQPPRATTHIHLLKQSTNLPPGKPVNCYYCPNCTSHVYHHQTVLGDKIVVRTSLLQGSKNFKVAAEIFGKDRFTWQPEVAHTFEGPPPS